VIWHSGCALAL